ncbi:MAG: 4Fe-4S binding protein [Firmicutes bacterium]|jgi:uncharacterized pyridoxamine 5'-phosphate oxidase family protein/NAD-dependent dihydropyrimidine dehydrogenase PreA subunit|nr:4Fe-4S binding protein [Bacillota bacterium]
MKALKMLREIKSVVISTVENGKAKSRIIDVMHVDEKGLYFVTAKTKPFYRQLMENMHVSITAMNKSYVQVRLDGEVEIVDEDIMDKIFHLNPSLKELFPNGFSSYVAFRVYKGKGEIFDLSGVEVKMRRERFVLGEGKVREAGCKITDSCISCGACIKVCPFGAISEDNKMFSINPEFCDECGLCVNSCPVDAIAYPTGM